MIRPLPDGGHWSVSLIDRHGILPGTVFSCQRSSTAHQSDFPHQTEDVRIVESTITVSGSLPDWWDGYPALPIAGSLNDVFDRQMNHARVWNGERKGLYVTKRTLVRSLGAIRIPRDGLQFREEESFGKTKIRASLDDGEHTYNLAVSSLSLHRLHEAQGIRAVNMILPASGILHVRVGLARAWKDQPDRCTVMINGVFW